MVIKTDLLRLYHAGNQVVPAEANRIANLTGKLTTSLELLNGQSALAGDPDAMTSMLTVANEVYDGLRGVVPVLNHCADALIATAKDFESVDGQSAAAAAQARRDLDSVPASVRHRSESLPSEPTKLDSRLGDPGAPWLRLDGHDPAGTTPTTPDPVAPGSVHPGVPHE